MYLWSIFVLATLESNKKYNTSNTSDLNNNHWKGYSLFIVLHRFLLFFLSLNLSRLRSLRDNSWFGYFWNIYRWKQINFSVCLVLCFCVVILICHFVFFYIIAIELWMLLFFWEQKISGAEQTQTKIKCGKTSWRKKMYLFWIFIEWKYKVNKNLFKKRKKQQSLIGIR